MTSLYTRATPRQAVVLRMIERKANTYRLYPTPEQARQMAQIAGSCLAEVYAIAPNELQPFLRRFRTAVQRKIKERGQT